MPAPPYSSPTVMPSTPSAPILRHKSIGNWSERSISAARGAISACAKSRTASRSASTSSPSWKFSPGRVVMQVSLDSNRRRTSPRVVDRSADWSTWLAPFAFGQQPLAFLLVRAHLVQRGMQVGHLLLELRAVRGQHAQELLQLRQGVARRLVHVDQLLDLG